MRFFTEASQTDLEKAGKKYQAHLLSIRSELSSGWQQLADGNFRDAKILAVKRPSKHQLIIELDSAVLNFTGVKFFWVPFSVENASWLNWEIDMADEGGINLEVALCKDIMRVIADDVSVTFFKNPLLKT